MAEKKGRSQGRWTLQMERGRKKKGKEGGLPELILFLRRMFGNRDRF